MHSCFFALKKGIFLSCTIQQRFCNLDLYVLVPISLCQGSCLCVIAEGRTHVRYVMVSSVLNTGSALVNPSRDHENNRQLLVHFVIHTHQCSRIAQNGG